MDNFEFLLVSLLKSKRFDLTTEKILQLEIWQVLKEKYPEIQREIHLSKEDRPDFFLNGIAIEVKIKGTVKSILAQCERYAEHDKVTGILLVTNRAMGFPKELNGKPCYVVNLGRAWL